MSPLQLRWMWKGFKAPGHLEPLAGTASGKGPPGPLPRSKARTAGGGATEAPILAPGRGVWGLGQELGQLLPLGPSLCPLAWVTLGPILGAEGRLEMQPEHLGSSEIMGRQARAVETRRDKFKGLQ